MLKKSFHKSKHNLNTFFKIVYKSFIKQVYAVLFDDFLSFFGRANYSIDVEFRDQKL